MPGTLSMLGPQATRESAPSFGFGSGTRAHREKVFISQEHSSLSSGESPGPAVYTQIPAVGIQQDSLKHSAAHYGFGTSDRDMVARVFISHEHAALTAPKGVPGANYEQETSVGKQANSKRATLPYYSFGSSTRDDANKVFISREHAKITGGAKLHEGPKYEISAVTGSLGTQAASYGPTGFQRHIKNGTQPSWAMGKAERFGKSSTGSSVAPGPGAYTTATAVSKQVISTKPSLPLYGFGSSTRDHQEKVFISPEHSAVTGGGEAPGPGTYPMGPMTGAKVASSRQVTGKSWGFGTSQRFHDPLAKTRAANPGPGMYMI